MRRVLVAVDFSPVTGPLMVETTALARVYDADLCLIHVGEPEPDFLGYDVGPESVREQVDRELHEEERELERLAASLRAGGLRVRARFERGPTVETILAEAERVDADWIAVGSHGHGGLHRTLLGSVSEGVLHHAGRPVLIVPAAGRES